MALTTPFAQNGDKLAIPQTASDSSVSYNLGFTYAYALPPEEGGKFIDRAQFNQLMFDTTSQVLANKKAISDLNSATYSKTEVNNLLNAKANANATVNLTGAQNIQGVKTFAAPPVSATNPTANNQVANKLYVDTVGNTAVKLTGNQEIAGTKTFTNNIVSPNITAMQNNLNTIFSSTTSPVKSQTTAKIIEVGAGGDFQDLLSAIAEARKYSSRVQIKLISDLNASANIQILLLNGMNIELLFNGFKIINTDLNTIHQFTLNATQIGVISKLSLKGFEFILVSGSSTTLLESVTIDNGQYDLADCVSVARSSFLGFPDNVQINVSHKGGRRAFGSLFGSIIAFGANVTITDNSTNGQCLLVGYGSIISAYTVTINSSIPKASQAAQAITGNGIIFGNYSL